MRMSHKVPSVGKVKVPKPDSLGIGWTWPKLTWPTTSPLSKMEAVWSSDAPEKDGGARRRRGVTSVTGPASSSVSGRTGAAQGGPRMAESEAQADSTLEDGPSLLASHTFIIPKKEIHMVPDMAKWKRSQAYAEYIGFILTLNEAVKGKKLTCEYKVSEGVEAVLSLLNTLDQWIDETPPVDQPSRFGNKAFRTWYSKLEQDAEGLVAAVIPPHLSAAVPEVAVYLKESVGNSTRIDYGTGHEAAFAAFLCCLCKIGVLKADDQLAIVFRVFNRYLEVMRKLQKTYRMEPAGSQGVWGLDDFQFLPFIWGSAQLIDHPTLEPRHFVDEKAVNENHKDYIFLECILFITQMKTGPFAEHSNQLWNISAVPTWSKVNQGLIRMYKAECLEKFPVIQHFKFGSLLPIQPMKS